MLLRILDELIYFLDSVRTKIIDKQQPEEDYSWMEELAEAYRNYGL
jgi:hypothetical protein